MTDELDSLMERIRKLTPSDKLRLAADLLERGKLDMAAAIATHATTELDGLKLIQKGQL